MAQNSDPSDLQRFVDAQEMAIDDARSELRAGRKRRHWIGFVFPQIEGLGSSPMAQRYAIRSLAEAGAYLKHRVLGKRLRECVGLVLAAGRPITEIFGYPDHHKFKSCITLFSAAAPKERVFADALEKLCGGKPDRATLDKVAGT